MIRQEVLDMTFSLTFTFMSAVVGGCSSFGGHSRHG